MSWIRDISDGLVNLDHVREVDIGEMDRPTEGTEADSADSDTHAVVARFPHGESVVIFTGDEAFCRLKLDSIAAKLPMVKV